jgi:hypothetical protein
MSGDSSFINLSVTEIMQHFELSVKESVNRLYGESLLTKLTLLPRHQYHYKFWKTTKERKLKTQKNLYLQNRKLTIVVDIAVAIDISFFDHILDLIVRQLFSQVCHHTTQLGGRYDTVVVFVKDSVNR